jgi:hypothetical protein
MTEEISDGHKKFMQSMDRADQMMPMLQKTHKIDKGIEVISATKGCPKQFCIVQKINYKPKPKWEGLRFHTRLCSENARATTHSKQE